MQRRLRAAMVARSLLACRPCRVIQWRVATYRATINGWNVPSARTLLVPARVGVD